eukprot:gene955-10721_t
MEEVDKIIIHSLRQVGCEIPQELQTIREFTANLVIEAASRCLNLINEGANLPTSLPGSMSARFRIGAGLAAACQDLGYPGEIGYQTFLYSNEHELRKVIMFLIEKLPKDTSEVEDEPLGASVLLNQRIAAEIKRQMSITWMPAYCTDRNIVWQGSKPRLWHSLGTSSHFAPNSAILNAPKGLGDIEKKLPKDLKLYYDKHLPLVIDQVPQERDVAFSLLSMNTAMNVAAAEWESEWNQAGLSSRLSEQTSTGGSLESTLVSLHTSAVAQHAGQLTIFKALTTQQVLNEYKKQKKEKLMKKMKEEMQKVVQKSDGTPTPSSQDLSELLASMAGSDSKSQVKGSRFTHAEKLQFAQDDEKIVTDASQQKVKDEEETEEEKQQKREEEISSLKSQFQEMTSQIEKLHLEIKQTQANSNHVKELEQASDTKSKDLEDSYRVKKRTIDLLPDAENNIVKLERNLPNIIIKPVIIVDLPSKWKKILNVLSSLSPFYVNVISRKCRLSCSGDL